MFVAGGYITTPGGGGDGRRARARRADSRDLPHRRGAQCRGSARPGALSARPRRRLHQADRDRRGAGDGQRARRARIQPRGDEGGLRRGEAARQLLHRPRPRRRGDQGGDPRRRADHRARELSRRRGHRAGQGAGACGSTWTSTTATGSRRSAPRRAGRPNICARIARPPTSSGGVSQRRCKAGAKLTFGTDAAVYPYGLGARQFAYMVRYGMTPMQAIQSATSEAARALGRAGQVGSIAPGAYGDLIAVRGDPLKRRDRARAGRRRDQGRETGRLVDPKGRGGPRLVWRKGLEWPR